MDNLITKRVKLREQMDAEWTKYREAIKTNKPFDETQNILLRIKELQKQIIEITNEIHKQLRIGD